MKRLLVFLLACTMLFAFTACSAAPKEEMGPGLRGDAAVPSGPPGEGAGATFGSPTDGGAAGSFGESVDASYGASMEIKGDAMVPEEPAVGSDGVDASQKLPAGTLTAGEWKDLEDLEFWTKLLNNNDWYAIMEARSLYPNKILQVYVHDGQGNPCYNVEVQLLSGQNVVYTARTDVGGNAWLLHSLNKTEDAVTAVQIGDKQYDIPEGVLDVTVEEAGIAVEALDLMLMVDTTGSMGDELRYLQTELEDMISRVAQSGKALSIHISVNFYRDAGDEYIVREYEFTANVEQALSALAEQSSAGGGDYPEAVHKALESIVYNHQWRGNAVKLCFFVLDAPPHSEQEIGGIDGVMLETIQAASAQGIRIIPLAASGVNTETEFLLRSWAVMTGGTYTFLTDHSGIGNDHLEPTIGAFDVEALNELMIRVICEYCGLTCEEQ